jgi:hypothetical protein
MTYRTIPVSGNGEFCPLGYSGVPIRSLDLDIVPIGYPVASKENRPFYRGVLKWRRTANRAAWYLVHAPIIPRPQSQRKNFPMVLPDAIYVTT